MQDHDEKSVLRYRSILMNEGWETVTNLNYRLEGLRGTPGIPSPCSFALEQFSSFLSWRLRYKGRRAFAASRLNDGLGNLSRRKTDHSVVNSPSWRRGEFYFVSYFFAIAIDNPVLDNCWASFSSATG